MTSASLVHLGSGGGSWVENIYETGFLDPFSLARPGDIEPGAGEQVYGPRWPLPVAQATKPGRRHSQPAGAFTFSLSDIIQWIIVLR